MKYPELKGACKHCPGGCMRLEDPNFQGVIKCEWLKPYEFDAWSEDYNKNRVYLGKM